MYLFCVLHIFSLSLWFFHQIKSCVMSLTNWLSLSPEMDPSLRRWPWRSRRTTTSSPFCSEGNISATTNTNWPSNSSSVREWTAAEHKSHLLLLTSVILILYIFSCSLYEYFELFCFNFYYHFYYFLIIIIFLILLFRFNLCFKF